MRRHHAVQNGGSGAVVVNDAADVNDAISGAVSRADRGGSGGGGFDAIVRLESVVIYPRGMEGETE